MNRRKKLNQILKANAKKASAKLAPKNKSTYVSKADRLKLATEAAVEPDAIAAPAGSASNNEAEAGLADKKV
jgi:hypothetical protein